MPGVRILHEVFDEAYDPPKSVEVQRSIRMDFLPNPGENIYFTESEFLTVTGRYWDEYGTTVLQTVSSVDENGVYLGLLTTNGWVLS